MAFVLKPVFVLFCLFLDPCGGVVNLRCLDVNVQLFLCWSIEQLSYWLTSALTSLESRPSPQGRKIREKNMRGSQPGWQQCKKRQNSWIFFCFEAFKWKLKWNLLFLDSSSVSCDFWKYKMLENLGQSCFFEVLSYFLDAGALKLLSVNKFSLCFTFPCWTMPVS